MGDWDTEVDAWLAETATCTRCGENLVRHEALIGSWLTAGPLPAPRVRGLCPDGEPHKAGDPRPAAEPQPQPEPAELRVRIHQHLRKYPRLTAHEISRALGVDKSPVRRRLLAMEADGEAVRDVTPKGPATRSAITRWRAT